MNFFKNRSDAGQQLAQTLLHYKNKKDTLILALPRGGVPIAFEIATVLQAPMTVFLVRKLGVPGHEEVAIGAIAEGEVRILNQDLVQQLSISESDIQYRVNQEQQELNRRLRYYRQSKPLPKLDNDTVILVDDGIATGATCKAAIHALKLLHPKKIIVATPVASKDSLEEISPLVDDVVCLATPEPFYSVGQWYQHFAQTNDHEVIRLLQSVPVKVNFEETKQV